MRDTYTGAMAVQRTSWIHKSAIRDPIILGGASLAIISVIQIVFSRQSWDDMAITLGYARTFASTGRIAITPWSEPCEGFSSVLWMLICSLLSRLTHTPDALLCAAKLLDLGFNLGAGWVTYRLAIRMGLRRPWLPAFLFIVCFPSLVEAINGMEHSLLAFLFMLLLWSEVGLIGRRRLLANSILGSLILLTRWESLYYLLFFAAARLLADGQHSAKRIDQYLWCLVFAGLSLLRLSIFGLLAPNTVYAKMDRVYSISNALVPGRIQVALGIVLIFNVLLVPFLAQRHRFGTWGSPRITVEQLLKDHRRTAICCLAMSAGAWSFELLAGKNWGFPGRMELFSLPAAMLLLAALWERFTMSTERSHRRMGRLAIWGFVVVSFGSAAVLLGKQRITVYGVKAQAAAVERVRTAVHAPVLNYLGADMGGLGLFFDNVKANDLALLTDATITRLGYSKLPDYVFETLRPDVIELHRPWDSASGLMRDRRLLSYYARVVSEGVPLLVRMNLVTALLAHGCLQQAAAPPVLLPTCSFPTSGTGEKGASYQSLSAGSSDRPL